jgi:hypothetical protein
MQENQLLSVLLLLNQKLQIIRLQQLLGIVAYRDFQSFVMLISRELRVLLPKEKVLDIFPAQIAIGIRYFIVSSVDTRYQS